MGRNSMKSPVKGVKMNVKQTKIEKPDVQEDSVLRESNEQSNEKTLTQAEKKYIFELIEKGYHIKDIEKKMKAIMHMSEEKIAIVLNGARRPSDIIMNMEKL